ncbi:hypothetical protein N0V82_008598 [Gnomoniopsis sp. IMI 355080]|nr:hypothetical protein N0V82_008598 [Gnomoniopsis sp. IMI 355080]
MWNPFRRPQRDLEQLQSPLIARLPPEIRYLIWNEAIGSRVLHIVRKRRRLLAMECVESFSPDLETTVHTCWGLSTTMGRRDGFYLGSRSRYPTRPANLLPLLQTCRRIYREAVTVLYENNVFDINHVDTLAYLGRTVLPQRLNRIRVLKFSFRFEHWDAAPYDLATWSETCDSLTRLAGLEELTIHLTGYDGRPVAGNRNKWHPILELLKQVKALKSFKVFLPLEEDLCLQMAREEEYSFNLLPRRQLPPAKWANDSCISV